MHPFMLVDSPVFYNPLLKCIIFSVFTQISYLSCKFFPIMHFLKIDAIILYSQGKPIRRHYCHYWRGCNLFFFWFKVIFFSYCFIFFVFYLKPVSGNCLVIMDVQEAETLSVWLVEKLQIVNAKGILHFFNLPLKRKTGWKNIVLRHKLCFI